MATVTELLDRGSRITALRATGAERAMALLALQDAYQQAVMDSECYIATPVSYTFVASSDDYSLSTLCGEQPTRLYHVGLTAAGTTNPLRQVSYQELLDLRDVDYGAGSPACYATMGFDRIAFHPNPAVGDVIKLNYLDPVPTLIEASPAAGQEITPSKIPINFHWSVLLPGMVIQMLDKDQRLAESKMWEDRYARGIARLTEHVGQMGGNANRAYVEKGMRRWHFNDQRSRW